MNRTKRTPSSLIWLFVLFKITHVRAGVAFNSSSTELYKPLVTLDSDFQYQKTAKQLRQASTIQQVQQNGQHDHLTPNYPRGQDWPPPEMLKIGERWTRSSPVVLITLQHDQFRSRDASFDGSRFWEARVRSCQPPLQS